VRTARISLAAWGLSAALAALAGILVAPLSSLDLNFGFTIMLAAFAAAVLGGFGNLWGVLIGASAIGVIQYLIGGYVLHDYASILPYVAMLAILGLRPQGLLGRTAARL
ncbi:MAG: branched-chain amino acid ABC transporter permease, partial [Rhodococcus sp. (in: high G+C Gram-positive bacteria)]